MASANFAYRTKDDSNSSSDSDSDEDCHDWKRSIKSNNAGESTGKINEIPSTPNDSSSNSGPQKRKRNNIWCEVIQDQMMSETLTHCGLNQKPKNYFNRGEESYDYTLKYKFSKKEDKSSNGEEETSDAEIPPKNNKVRKDKYVKLNSAAEVEAAHKIIDALNEKKGYLIFRVVKHCGIEKSLKLLSMTLDIEENGGMMVKNNYRRRTAGGVYFQLLKNDKDIKKSTVDKIFEGELNSYQMKKKFDTKRKKKLLNAVKKELESMIADKVAEKKMSEPTNEDEPITDSMETEDSTSQPIATQVYPTNDNKATDLEDGEIED